MLEPLKFASCTEVRPAGVQTPPTEGQFFDRVINPWPNMSKIEHGTQ